MRLGVHLAVVALAVLAATSALGQETPIASGTQVKLKVGQQKTLNVGLAIGLECNDGTVVQAELRALSPSANELVLIGLKPGKTACRAGTANVARSKLVYIQVNPASTSQP
jgi:hypothetical protein